MCVKGHLNSNFLRLYYHSKNMGKLFLIPVFVFIVLIPMLNYMQYLLNGIGEELYLNVIRYGQWLMPFFSVYHTIFVMREFVESKGYELFHTLEKRLLFVDILGIFGVNLLLVSVLFFGYAFILPNMFLEYIRILTSCFLFFSMAYGITYLFKSATPTILILIVYWLATIIIVKDEAVLFLFYNLEMMSWQLFFSHYLILILIGCLLLVIGYYKGSKY